MPVRFLPVEVPYKMNLLRRRMHVMAMFASANIFIHSDAIGILFVNEQIFLGRRIYY